MQCLYFFCWALHSGFKVTNPGIIGTLYFLRLYRATHGYHVDCSGMPKLLLQNSACCCVLWKSSLAHLQYLVRRQCKGMLYCVVHEARARKLCLFFSIGSISSYFWSTVGWIHRSKSTDRGLPCSYFTEAHLSKGRGGMGLFLPQTSLLEENAQGPSLNMGGVNPHGLSAGLWWDMRCNKADLRLCFWPDLMTY